MCKLQNELFQIIILADLSAGGEAQCAQAIKSDKLVRILPRVPRIDRSSWLFKMWWTYTHDHLGGGDTGTPVLDFWWRLLCDPHLLPHIANLLIGSIVEQQFRTMAQCCHLLALSPCLVLESSKQASRVPCPTPCPAHAPVYKSQKWPQSWSSTPEKGPMCLGLMFP